MLPARQVKVQPIHVACKFGFLNVIRTLHAAVESLDREEGRGLQLLHVAAREFECPLIIEGLTAQLY